MDPNDQVGEENGQNLEALSGCGREERKRYPGCPPGFWLGN